MVLPSGCGEAFGSAFGTSGGRAGVGRVTDGGVTCNDESEGVPGEAGVGASELPGDEIPCAAEGVLADDPPLLSALCCAWAILPAPSASVRKKIEARNLKAEDLTMAGGFF